MMSNSEVRGMEGGDRVVTYEVEVDDNMMLNESTVSEETELGMLVDSIYRDDGEHYAVPNVIERPVVVPSQDATMSPAVVPVESAGESMDVEFDGDVREEAEARRINDLTQRYLTGKLTFSEFVRGTDGDEMDQEKDQSDSDYEPSPPKRKSKAKQSSEAFCQEFDATTKAYRRSNKASKVGLPRERRILPPVLSNLLGQANLKYAQNEKDVAVQICEEIIRQVPQAPGPYKLLALVHRDRGNDALAHHYSLIAAHLSPPSCDDWVQLAETSLELGEKEQALTCLAQAIKGDRYNPDPRLRQIKLLQSMGETRAAQRSRERMVESLCSSSQMTQRHGRLILLQAKIAAREFHQENNLIKATKIMECAITACKTSAVQDDIHLLVELQCEQNENMKGLAILQRECQVELIPTQPPFQSCTCPDSLAPDLRAKLIVFLVRLDIEPKILSSLLEPFLHSNPDDEGDLFLDIVEALMAKSRYEEAMLLLEPLVASEAFSRAAVWLTHGECLRNLGHVEVAVTSYHNVMQLAPQHVQARLTLSSLLCQMGKFEEALEVLDSKDPEPRLLYEKFHLLQQSESHQEMAVDAAIALMSQYIRGDKLKEMYESLTHRRRYLHKEKFVDNGPGKAELFEVAKKAGDICVKEKHFKKFKRLAYICLYVKPLTDYKKELEYLCLIASVHAKDANLCWLLMRDILTRNQDSFNAWNLFALAVKYPEDAKHTRFITRILSKNPSNWASGICYANNCFIAGAYKDALVEYGSRHKVSPSPYTALMLGISWTHIACQKRQTDRHMAVIQARAFFEEYARLRGGKCKQEIYYNLGRAMHQLSLMELAMGYYYKALQCPLSPDSSNVLCLNKETAYNLACLFKSSGNIKLARKIINEYIVI